MHPKKIGILSKLNKLVRDIFCKPGSYRLSLSRLIFLSTFVLCIYTTLFRNMVLGPWMTLLMALIPYMWLDKRTVEPKNSNPEPQPESDTEEDKEP